MNDAILVLNAGSSSVKFSLFARTADGPTLAAHGQVEAVNSSPRFMATGPDGGVEKHIWPVGTPLGHDGAVGHIVEWLKAHCAADYRLVAAGHRVVHGGVEHAAPIRLDADALAALEKLTPLAPLHQPHNVAPVRSLMERLPELPQVACFDTAFHRTHPRVAQMFALPAALTDAGVRRYGFHGLSYEYIARTLPDVDERAAKGRTVVLHLGNGASMCGLKGGLSVATTMGFTAVDGLPMGTRCGALDPGVLLYLMNERGMDAQALENLIYRESGLLGVSGVSSDMRQLLGSTDDSARDAVDLFVYRIGLELGALASALGGVDALVFTAGVGENAAGLRAEICAGLACLGLAIDPARNAAARPDADVAAAGHILVVHAEEERMIARETARLT